VAASGADRRWCASLVCASATAAAVAASALGPPTYVITGWRDEHRTGEDDQLTACLIERARTGRPLDAAATARAVATSQEAEVTLALGPDHVDPRDVELATRVDAFGFAMEAHPHPDGLFLLPQKEPTSL